MRRQAARPEQHGAELARDVAEVDAALRSIGSPGAVVARHFAFMDSAYEGRRLSWGRFRERTSTRV